MDYHIFFFYSSIVGHLSCFGFWLLWIMLLWISVCRFFVWTYVSLCLTSSTLLCFLWKLSFCPCLQRHLFFFHIFSNIILILVTLLFLNRIGYPSPIILLRLTWMFGESKGGLVKFPGLLDLNLRKGPAVNLSYNVGNWENFVWGEFSLTNPCSAKQSCSFFHYIRGRAFEIFALSWFYK